MATANITYNGSRFFNGTWSSSYSTNGPGSYGTYAGYSDRSHVTLWKITTPAFTGTGTSITINFDYFNKKATSLKWHLASNENTSAFTNAVGSVSDVYGLIAATFTLANSSSQWKSTSITMTYAFKPSTTYYVYLYPQNTTTGDATIGNVSGHKVTGTINYNTAPTVYTVSCEDRITTWNGTLIDVLPSRQYEAGSTAKGSDWGSNTEENAYYNGYHYTDCGQGVVNSNMTTYRFFERNKLTFKYNANGGTGTMADTTISYGILTPIKINTFTREGYTFAYWKAYRDYDEKWRGYNADGKDGWYDPSEIVRYWEYTDGISVSTTAYSGTITLYAEWKANPGVFIRSGSTWKYHTPYAYKNGKYEKCDDYVRKSNTWT